MTSPFADVLAALAAAMRDLGARWYLFGAQAALVHGSARLTSDVDATVAWDGDVSLLVAALRRHGFELRPVPADFVEHTRVLPLVHRDTSTPADVVLAGPGLEQVFLSRAVEHDVEGVTIPVATPEDLIVMKILGGRPKDLEDVRALAAANEQLDLEHARTLLRELELALDRGDLILALEGALRLP